MGLIKATLNSVGSVIGDQFEEYVTCPTTDSNVLVVRGEVNHGKGNKGASDGIISNGSLIVVPAGYAAMIIDNGAIKEFTAEPGEFTWDSSSEPSVFEGGFFKGIGDSIKKIGSRITYGGQTAKDQRVYYINLLNITGNKFGSADSQVVSDPVYGSVEITFFGEYSFKVVDPAVLVASLIGANAADQITVDEVVGGQLKLQFASNVSTCISQLMINNNISFNAVQSYKNDVVATMNNLLDESWRQQYGLEIQDVALNINASEESKELIRNVDSEIAREKRRGDLYSQNPSGQMAAASADAMVKAAGNENGAMMGFAGMNFAGGAGTNMMGAAAAMTPAEGAAKEATVQPGETDVNMEAPVKGAKFCPNCGTAASGKFCTNCGTEL